MGTHPSAEFFEEVEGGAGYLVRSMALIDTPTTPHFTQSYSLSRRRHMAATTAPGIEELTLTLNQEIHVRAPIETTFAALLDEVGPYNETHDGKPLAMKIEARPGGRWVRAEAAKTGKR